MIQRGEELRLAVEAGGALGIEAIGDNLDCHVASELRIVGTIDLPMPPAPSAPPTS